MALAVRDRGPDGQPLISVLRRIYWREPVRRLTALHTALTQARALATTPDEMEWCDRRLEVLGPILTEKTAQQAHERDQLAAQQAALAQQGPGPGPGASGPPGPPSGLGPH